LAAGVFANGHSGTQAFGENSFEATGVHLTAQFFYMHWRLFTKHATRRLLIKHPTRDQFFSPRFYIFVTFLILYVNFKGSYGKPAIASGNAFLNHAKNLK